MTFDKSFQFFYTTQNGDLFKIYKKRCMKDYFITRLYIFSIEKNKLIGLPKSKVRISGLKYYLEDIAFNNHFKLVKEIIKN